MHILWRQRWKRPKNTNVKKYKCLKVQKFKCTKDQSSKSSEIWTLEFSCPKFSYQKFRRPALEEYSTNIWEIPTFFETLFTLLRSSDTRCWPPFLPPLIWKMHLVASRFSSLDRLGVTKTFCSVPPPPIKYWKKV